MLRYQVRDSEYGSVQREPLCYLGTEDIKARLTLWYLAMVGLTVSRLLKVTVSNRSIYWWAVWN